MNVAASAVDIFAGIASSESQQKSILASYDRRSEEWQLQSILAAYDVKQVNQQIVSCAIREQIARRNLETHQENMRQNKERLTFLQTKFTNEQLYQWMSKRLMEVQFQTYTLAYQVSLMAQRAFQYEYNSDRNFLNFTPWDSAHQGMTAAESLMLSLNQMEVAVLDYSRPFEIEKTISLAAISPTALMALRETGECEFAFTEALFDYDFPGHYNRKIKTVSVSIPSVTGPYQNIKATLTQTGNRMVLKSDESGLTAVSFLLGGTAKEPEASALRTNWSNAQSVILSRGHDDTGVLSADFADGRYLPFEGTGAVSDWHLSMPKSTNLFSFDTIADVIITVQYTARDGGAGFKNKVLSLAPLQVYSGVEYIDCRSMFHSQWQTFFASAPGGTQTQSLSLPIPSIVPSNVHGAKLLKVRVYLDALEAAMGDYLRLYLSQHLSLPVSIQEKNAGICELNDQQQKNAEVETICAQPMRLDFDLQKTPETLKKDGRLDPEKLKNIALIITYSGTTEKIAKQGRKISGQPRSATRKGA